MNTPCPSGPAPSWDSQIHPDSGGVSTYWTRLTGARPRCVVLCNFDQFSVYDFHSNLDVLKDNLDEQVEKVIEANRLLEEQRSKLIEAVKDKKIMEKHREKKLDEYNKLMQDLELKFMDEIATQRFRRQEKP